MGRESKISWTDATFNPWIGCTKVSAGCAHCYAETQNERYGWNKAGWGKGSPRKRTSEANWKQPLKWDRQAAAEGVMRRVFCASLADVFDDEVPSEWRADLWKLIEQTPHLEWMLLTKRPENIEDMLPAAWIANPPNNVRLGATVENEDMADERISYLIDVWTGRNFLSVEPMLSKIFIKYSLEGNKEYFGEQQWMTTEPIDWVICGGESGPGARPMEIEWALDLLRQCRETRTPFFFKQLGGFPEKRDQPEQWPEELRVQEFPE